MAAVNKQIKSCQQSVNDDVNSSARLNRLRKRCGREISAKDIQEDERLAYLIGK